MYKTGNVAFSLLKGFDGRRPDFLSNAIYLGVRWPKGSFRPLLSLQEGEVGESGVAV